MPEEPIIGGSEPVRYDMSDEAHTIPMRRNWNKVTSLKDAIAAVQKEFGGEVISSKDLLGNEFDRATKEALVGIPFLILEYGFTESDQFGEGREYVWVRAIRADNEERVAFSDGGTGIYVQLKELAEATNQYGGVMCRSGLRVSEYDKELPDGTMLRNVETFYIDS